MINTMFFYLSLTCLLLRTFRKVELCNNYDLIDNCIKEEAWECIFGIASEGNKKVSLFYFSHRQVHLTLKLLRQEIAL